MSALFAFLHHVAAFSLVSAIAVEFFVLRAELTAGTARILLRADLAYGVSAGIVLLIGLIRVFYLEKGAGYYFASVPFIAKLTLFAAVGLLSIYPTIKFLSWREAVRADRAPAADPATLASLRTVLHVELAGIVLIVLCAALMARGIGVVG
jgi:putative membrane protein